MNAPDRALLASPPLAHIALRHLAPAAHTLESSPVAVWLGSLRDADPPPDLPATLQVQSGLERATLRVAGSVAISRPLSSSGICRGGFVM